MANAIDILTEHLKKNPNALDDALEKYFRGNREFMPTPEEFDRICPKGEGPHEGKTVWNRFVAEYYQRERDRLERGGWIGSSSLHDKVMETLSRKYKLFKTEKICSFETMPFPTHIILKPRQAAPVPLQGERMKQSTDLEDVD